MLTYLYNSIMSETAKTLPWDNPRSEVARQLIRIRNTERGGLYRTDRTGAEYVYNLCGLEYLFDHVRSLRTSSIILDVGSGTTRGIYELSISSLGHGLQFKATVLNIKSSLVSQYLGKEHTHATSVEVLRGIQNNSIGAVLGMASVGYSDQPALAVRSIDRILVPGGVFKGTFLRSERVEPQDSFGFKRYHAFKKAFQEKRYDTDIEFGGKEDVLLAIKPGGEKQITAQELLQRDSETAISQMEAVSDEMKSRGGV